MKIFIYFILFFVLAAILSDFLKIDESISMIISFIMIFFIIGSTNKKNKTEPQIIVNSKEKINSPKDIIKRSEEIKKNVKNRKIDNLISELFFDNIQYYSSWLNNGNKIYVPSIISGSVRKKEDNKNITTVIINDNEYSFSFEEKSFYALNDYLTHGNLILYKKKKKLLELNLSQEQNEYTSYWRTFGIEAFIDGTWIKDFELLKSEINRERKLREEKELYDKSKIEKIKDNFGIK